MYAGYISKEIYFQETSQSPYEQLLGKLVEHQGWLVCSEHSLTQTTESTVNDQLTQLQVFIYFLDINDENLTNLRQHCILLRRGAHLEHCLQNISQTDALHLVFSLNIFIKCQTNIFILLLYI